MYFNFVIFQTLQDTNLYYIILNIATCICLLYCKNFVSIFVKVCAFSTKLILTFCKTNTFSTYTLI